MCSISTNNSRIFEHIIYFQTSFITELIRARRRTYLQCRNRSLYQEGEDQGNNKLPMWLKLNTWVTFAN